MSKFVSERRQSQSLSLICVFVVLTGLERDKIQSEYDDLLALIARFSRYSC